MPEIRIMKQKKKFTEYFEDRKMMQSIYAMKLVDKYHTGERRGGGPERSHLYEVAGQTLAFLEGKVTDYALDCVVAASFLHDLVEDYADLYSEDDLKRDFDILTAELVMNVCKWKGFKKVPEHYDVYFAQVSQDILSIFIKVSDRIHNLSTCINGMSPARIHKYIYETETYFYPMIKKARNDNHKLYMALTSMKQQLEYRVMMIKLVLDSKAKEAPETAEAE